MTSDPRDTSSPGPLGARDEQRQQQQQAPAAGPTPPAAPGQAGGRGRHARWQDGEQATGQDAYQQGFYEQPQFGQGPAGPGGYGQMPGYGADGYGTQAPPQQGYGRVPGQQPGYQRQPGYWPWAPGQQADGQAGDGDADYAAPGERGPAWPGGPELGAPRGGGRAKGSRPWRSRKVLLPALAGGLAVVLAVTLTVVFASRGPGAPATGMIPTGSTPRQDGRQVASAFLTDWEKGELAKAANLTSDPAAAKAALVAYAKDLGLSKVGFGITGEVDATQASTGTTPAAPREQVTYSANAAVSSGTGANELRSNWRYHTSLFAYEQGTTNIWFVAWQPDVLGPNLTATTHLAAVQVPPGVEMVGDADNGNLTSYGDPGLNNVSALLMQAAPPGEGKPGLDVQIETAAGAPVKDSQEVLTDPQNVQSVDTTINPAAEAAAQAAVKMKPMSSMVVIQPSTGKILAIANNDGMNDFALTAAVAPGSTMKIITSTALIDEDGFTPQTPDTCPPVFMGIHNDTTDGVEETYPAGTPFITDFAQSCNNAFTTQYAKLNSPLAGTANQLAGTAKEYYGLDQNWNIGISGDSTSYFNAPASAAGTELAEEAFGQGALVASPLAMASIAATVDTGTFKQPYLVPGTKQLTATPLPATTDADLKEMMRAVVTEGTAEGVGLGPNVYAKTGTAEVANQTQPNAWLTAFDTGQNLAVAVLVLQGGYGATAAAPEVAQFLNSY